MSDLDIHYEPFDAKVVYAVDHIVDIAKKNGSKGVIQTSQDWETLKQIWDTWVKMYPGQYKAFCTAIRTFKREELPHGVGGDKGARIQHLVEVPQKFELMAKAVFPDQKWDRKFIMKLVQHLPQLKVTNDGF